MAKTFICSDESVNSYGYRVLTSGINFKNFKKNPVMLFNHESYSWGGDIYNGPVGRWENIRVEDGKLKADAVIDENDPKGAIINNKIENDFIRAASIGFRVLSISEKPEDMIKGQTRPTITECELIEISVVDIPANKNALALYDKEGNKIELTEEGFEKVNLSLIKKTEQKSDNTMKLNLKAGWTALKAWLGIDKEGDVEHEMTPEELKRLNDDLVKLDDVKAKLQLAETLAAERLTLLNAATNKITEVEGTLVDEKARADKAEAALAEANGKLAELEGDGGKEPGKEEPEQGGNGNEEELGPSGRAALVYREENAD